MVLSIVLVLLQGQMIQFWEDCIQMMLFETLQTTLDSQDVELVDRVIVLNKWHCSCVAFVHLLKSLAISGTGTLRCLQKEMASYRHWSVSLWLHSADEDAVSSLTSYGSWNAYEKKLRREAYLPLVVLSSAFILSVWGEILARACVKNGIIRSMLRHFIFNFIINPTIPRLHC